VADGAGAAAVSGALGRIADLLGVALRVGDASVARITGAGDAEQAARAVGVEGADADAGRAAGQAERAHGVVGARHGDPRVGRAAARDAELVGLAHAVE